MTTSTSTSASATMPTVATTDLSVDSMSTVVPNSNPANSSTYFSNSSSPQNSPIMYTTRQIKEIESKILYDYVHKMPYVDRKYFITSVIERCDLPRRHFYNWQDGYARIPTFAKNHIEEIVGFPMFESTRHMG